MGEIAGYDLPSRFRARRWLALAPQVGEDLFIKLHTHGTQDRNSGPLLNGGLDALFEAMSVECTAAGLNLRYSTAWEMVQTIVRGD